MYSSSRIRAGAIGHIALEPATRCGSSRRRSRQRRPGVPRPACATSTATAAPRRSRRRPTPRRAGGRGTRPACGRARRPGAASGRAGRRRAAPIERPTASRRPSSGGPNKRASALLHVGTGRASRAGSAMPERAFARPPHTAGPAEPDASVGGTTSAANAAAPPRHGRRGEEPPAVTPRPPLANGRGLDRLPTEPAEHGDADRSQHAREHAA